MKQFSLFLVLATILIADVSAHAFYNSASGRWLSRDPIEENGGGNLYSFVFNNGISFQDVLGLAADCKTIDTSKWAVTAQWSPISMTCNCHATRTIKQHCTKKCPGGLKVTLISKVDDSVSDQGCFEKGDKLPCAGEKSDSSIDVTLSTPSNDILSCLGLSAKDWSVQLSGPCNKEWDETDTETKYLYKPPGSKGFNEKSDCDKECEGWEKKLNPQ